ELHAGDGAALERWRRDVLTGPLAEPARTRVGIVRAGGPAADDPRLVALAVGRQEHLADAVGFLTAEHAHESGTRGGHGRALGAEARGVEGGVVASHADGQCQIGVRERSASAPNAASGSDRVI